MALTLDSIFEGGYDLVQKEHTFLLAKLGKKKAIFADRFVEVVQSRKVYDIFGKIFVKRSLRVTLLAKSGNLKSGGIQIDLEVVLLV
eukprot:snap_masked-scaffold_21-processed-gene-5.39-mRNA-1 protein AED:1.00 eAED:1.00 QI:0/0/0/0/1/1/3/0/86